MLKADPGNGNTIPLRPIKTTPNNSGRPRTPVCVPTIYLDGHTLFFETSCDGCTLMLLDEDGNVAYSLVIPTGTTSLTLPATVTKPDGLWNIEYGYGLADAYNSVINTPSNVYIQNEVIMGNRVISADSIFVGKNVTDDKPYGNVTLGQGEIILKASYIEIKNSTTVPLGTTLKIVN